MTYFKSRMVDGIGLNDSKIKLTRTDTGNVLNLDYCYPGTDGEIKIIPFNLKREVYLVDSGSTSAGQRWKVWEYTRWTPEQEKQKGTKSHMPKGETPPPFICKNVLEAFEKGLEIPTLILTEGYIKAISGSLKGLYVIGLPSITIYNSKETGTLFEEILQVIDICRVRNVILLYDNDSLNIGKHLDQDLTKRPKQFFNSAVNIRDQIRANNDINIYWARSLKEDANGLDDIILKYSESYKELPNIRTLKGIYFEKININRADDKLKKHLRLHDVNEFYALHKKTIGDIEFLWYGNKYQFKNDKAVRVFKDIGIFRIGDDFFQRINKPDIRGNLKPTIDIRKRQTIIDDYGKEFIKSMPKFISFCNIPSNNGTYRQIIDGCYNVYNQCNFEIKKGKFDNTDKLLHHIFGDQYEIGIDYLRVMWQKPTHILPILCLVSRLRSTGKTTFIDWLNEVWGENSVILGNDELQESFNSIYATKTLIMCDESRIDKTHVLEKLKALSTQKKINIHYKFGQRHTSAFYGKIILLSNYEDNFINTDSDEVRFWVRKVPVVSEWDPEFEQKLKDEIPAFLYHLSNTKINYEKKTRQWFDSKDLETDALLNIVANSKTWLYKTLRELFQDYFDNEDTDCNEIYVTPKDIKEKWFHNNPQVTYPFIANVLRNEFKIEPPLKTFRYWKIKGILNNTSSSIGEAYKIERNMFKIFTEETEEQPFVKPEQKDILF